MPTLAFFPWLRLDATPNSLGPWQADRLPAAGQPFHVGPWQLRPWHRNTGTASAWSGTELRLIKQATNTWFETPTMPISGATIAVKAGAAAGVDLSEDEHAELRDVEVIVAFCGLAEREYFGGDSYVNTGTLELIVQRFSVSGKGFSIPSRRRDGSSSLWTSKKYHRDMRPLHVHLANGVSLNQPLLDSLWELRSTREWPAFRRALALFNQANTDSDRISLDMEAGLVASAFERVLELHVGKWSRKGTPTEQEIGSAFASATSAASALQRTAWTRNALPTARAQEVTLREAWIRDLWNTRGKVAHGSEVVCLSAGWTVQEHLLLAAIAFPLLVKCELKARLGYGLDRWGHLRLVALERLMDANLLQNASDNAAWPYRAVIADVLEKDLMNQGFV